MTIKQVLQSLGSWELSLSEETPDEILSKLGPFGHVVVVRGAVDVALTSSSLLSSARYVGVLRESLKDSDGTTAMSGSGMAVWLGDEDKKGYVFETKVVLTNATLAAAIAAVLPPTVQTGTINSAAGTFNGTFQFQTPREALDMICDAFNVEWRVNGNGTLDVGTQAQLYSSTPSAIIVRKPATGRDMDLVALDSDFQVDTSMVDYTTRVLLLGSSLDDGTFATGSADAPSVPYFDLFGNTVKWTRMISESAESTGSVASRAQLQLNRFNRVGKSLKVTTRQYETEGNFVVGDNAWVYDPETGLVNAANQIYFRGEVVHPDMLRVSEIAWPVTEGHTVAFRTHLGEWLDLTRYVMWETGDNEITVGDLPKSLTGGSSNPMTDRVDSAPDSTVPGPPTGLSLVTDAVVDPRTGENSSIIRATWNAPATNVDGSVITDLSYYLIQYRWASRSPSWTENRISNTTNTDIVGLVTGLVYDVRVAAVDLTNHISPFSSVVSITAAADATPPGVPADPVVTNYLGQLRIVWSGLTSTGTAMPSDFNRVEVHVSATTGFTPSSATLVDSLSTGGVSYATAPYGAARFVKLVAVDNAGNRSAASAQVTGTTTQIVGTDILDGAIAAAELADSAVTNAKLGLGAVTGLKIADFAVGTQQIADLAVSTGKIDNLAVGSAKIADLAVATAKIADLAVANAKIGNLAVNDGKVANLAVGKLTAGTMSADVVMSGRFATALTGARVEMNALGFQKFASDNSLLVSITGSTALITGNYKSASSGRRIEMGSSGAIGQITFYAPDGSNSFVRSYTDGTQSQEGLQIGVPVPGATETWNAMYYNQQEWASYHSMIHDFVYQTRWGVWQTFSRSTTDNKLRVFVDTAGFQLRGGGAGDNSQFFTYDFASSGIDVQYGGTGRFLLRAGGGGGSPTLQLLNGSDGLGGLIKSFSDGRGIAIEFRNQFDNGFMGIRAGVFEVNSDERGKNNIRDVVITSALAEVGKVKPRVFKRKGNNQRPVLDDEGNMIGTEPVEAPDEIGVLAQEAPAFIVTGSEDTELGIDMMKFNLLNAAAVQELAGLVTTLRSDVDLLKKGTKK